MSSITHNTRRSHFVTVDGKQLWREGHGLACACESCNAYDAQFTDEQIAQAWRYASERRVSLQLLPSGNVVLYDYELRPFYIGDWFGVRAAYEARPKFIPTAKMWSPDKSPAKIAGIDLNDLIIDL